jgi:hypothetical protein
MRDSHTYGRRLIPRISQRCSDEVLQHPRSLVRLIRRYPVATKSRKVFTHWQESNLQDDMHLWKAFPFIPVRFHPHIIWTVHTYCLTFSCAFLCYTPISSSCQLWTVQYTSICSCLWEFINTKQLKTQTAENHCIGNFGNLLQTIHAKLETHHCINCWDWAQSSLTTHKKLSLYQTTLKGLQRMFIGHEMCVSVFSRTFVWKFFMWFRYAIVACPHRAATTIVKCPSMCNDLTIEN